MAIALTGLKTVDVAKASNISRSTLSNMMGLDLLSVEEKKKRPSPNLSSMERVKEILSSVLNSHGYGFSTDGEIVKANRAVHEDGIAPIGDK